ncbi:Alpha N-terminal protein methyltransferase 1 [Aspergillus hancockii]|nr:Alpha N-terminal protein methyltransferase 1 [Aspergillus hancockii]
MASDPVATQGSNETKPAPVAPADSNIDHTASIRYWNSVPANANVMLGMLGNYPWYTRIDLRGSKTFLSKVRRLVPGCTTEGKLKQGVDCGAGVGRVTEGFLSHVCDTVDAVEPVEKFVQVMQNSALKRSGVVGDIYTVGLEGWYPEKKYDLIWTQFCVGHLTDAQLVEYFVRCREHLTEAGLVVVKENMSTDPNGEDMYDAEDSSVTRTDEKFREIFSQAGLLVITSELQLGFPKNFKLLPVKFYALRPKS